VAVVHRGGRTVRATAISALAVHRMIKDGCHRGKDRI